MESILTVNARGNVLIPLQKFRQSDTSPEAGLELGTIELFDAKVIISESKPSTCAEVATLQQCKQELAQAESTLTTSAPSTSIQLTLTLTDRQTMLKSQLRLGQPA